MSEVKLINTRILIKCDTGLRLKLSLIYIFNMYVYNKCELNLNIEKNWMKKHMTSSKGKVVGEYNAACGACGTKYRNLIIGHEEGRTASGKQIGGRSMKVGDSARTRERRSE